MKAFKLPVITTAVQPVIEFAVCTVVAVIEFMHLKRALCEHKKKETSFP